MQCDQTAMNGSLKSLGGKSAEYEGTAVAWNDNQRHVVQGQISCWGGNITDARIISKKQGKVLPFVRSCNLNEKLGMTTADKLDVVVNGEGTTMQSFLENIEEHSKYRGMPSIKAKIRPNHPIVLRAMNVTVPLDENEEHDDICPAHYSYQTTDKNDPRNLIVAFTPTGYSVHTDTPGINPLLSHSVAGDGTVDSHWFVAEPTQHKVGKAQLADKDPVGLPAKKARSTSIGHKGMGPRNNCFIVASIPRQQKPQVVRSGGYESSWSNPEDPLAHKYRSLGASEGTASAARMSVNEESNGKVAAFENECERPDNEPIVVTIMLFNTLKANETSKSVTFAKEDLASMVSDMEEIYDLCDARGTISELPAMLKKFDKADMDVIRKKMSEDPQPPLGEANPFVFSKSAMQNVL